jgi:hypothetical protein
VWPWTDKCERLASPSSLVFGKSSPVVELCLCLICKVPERVPLWTSLSVECNLWRVFISMDSAKEHYRYNVQHHYW